MGLSQREKEELELLELENENAQAMQMRDSVASDPPQSSGPIEEGVRPENPIGMAGTALQLAGYGANKIAGSVAEQAGKLGVPTLGAISALPLGVAGDALDFLGNGLKPESTAQVAGLVLGNEAGAALGQARRIAPLAEKYTPTIARAVKAAAAMNIDLTPAEQIGSKLMSMVENGLSYIPYSASVIQRFRDARYAKLVSARNAIVEKIGKPMESNAMGEEVLSKLSQSMDSISDTRLKELKSVHSKLLSKYGPTQSNVQLGELIQARTAATKDIARAHGNALFDEVAKAIPDELNAVRPTAMMERANHHLEKYANLPKGTVPEGLLEDLRQIARGPKKAVIAMRELGDAAKGDPNVKAHLMGALGEGGGGLAPSVQEAIAKRAGYTFEEMQNLRSIFGQKAVQANPLLKVAPGGGAGGTIESAIYQDLKRAADKDIADFAGSVGGDVKTKHDLAISFWKDYKGTHDNQTIRRLIKSEPEGVYQMMVGNGRVANLQALKSAVGEGNFQAVKSRWVRDLFAEKDGVPDFPGAMKSLAEHEPEFIKTMLSPSEHKDLLRAIETGTAPRFMQSEIEKRIAGLLKKDPQKVVDSILSGNVETAKAAASVGGPAVMPYFRRRLMENIIGGTEDKLFTEGAMKRVMEKYDPELLRTFLGKDEIKEMQSLASVVGQISKVSKLGDNPSGTAGALLTANIISGIGAVPGFILHSPLGALGGAGAAVLTTYAMAQLYLTKAGRKALTEGLKLSASDRKAASVAARIATLAGVSRSKRK